MKVLGWIQKMTVMIHIITILVKNMPIVHKVLEIPLLRKRKIWKIIQFIHLLLAGKGKILLTVEIVIPIHKN